MVFGDVPPLPTCTESYAFQVAGHSRENASSFEILRDKSKPIIYKSLQDRERGMREVMFYQRVFSPNASEALKRVRQFIPTYYGVYQCPGTKAYYMGLSDLVANFKQPNICDFKMGTVTYFPGTPQEKISREQLKYVWRRKLGFVLSGMQISDTTNHCLIKLPKKFGRTLTPEQVYSIVVKSFLGTDPMYSVKLAQNYIIQLGRILNWYVEYGAKELTFCRSSILLIHESLPTTTTTDNIDTTSNNDNNNNHNHCPLKSSSSASASSSTNNIHPTLCTSRNPTGNNSSTLLNQSIETVNHIDHFNDNLSGHKSSPNNGSSSSSSTTITTTPSTPTVHAQVYLIDFAHWTKKYSNLPNNNIHNTDDVDDDVDDDDHSTNCWTCELTHGFRYGLENLINFMQRVVNTTTTTTTTENNAICINS
ncbi:unnamed protein product [Schistosoma turkestanicum]|nr:unnamed protein product [Schistosoma turkestanicum]